MLKLTSKYRTHTCGELSASEVGEDVTLSGWIMRMRDHGGVVFVDLRDHYGKTQVVFHENERDQIQNTRVESVISVKGKILKRAPELINPKIKTGEIEVHCTELEVLSQAKVLPFQIAEDDNAPEATRLSYRFLELRREELHKNIILRSEVIAKTREIMSGLGFTEFQTPILTSSSPEGARDFIVPSRLHPGKFFALPQAPQQFKQLIMVAGFDRYYQIAPCFRDEDPRADRSPGEFYQIDLEMSYVEQEDVIKMNEALLEPLFTAFSDKPLNPAPPFPRFKYKEAMERFGTDKPDLRITAELQQVSEVFSATEFRVFKQILEDGGSIYSLPVSLGEIPSRKYFDDTIADFQKMSGFGLAYLAYDDSGYKGSIAKFVSDDEAQALKAKCGLDGTGVIFIVAGKSNEILPWLGKFRVKVADEFNIREEGDWRFCWITDYPLYELDEKTGEIEFSHNPFSMPHGGLEALKTKDPLEVYGYQYDIVCNGYELASGAIRNHIPEVMYKAFEIVGHGKEVVDNKFAGMIEAFRYGAPPHGGIAYGIERIVMLLAGEDAIRDVIMYPLAQSAEDLMMKAPSELSEAQLKEVHIRLELPPEKEESN